MPDTLQSQTGFWWKLSGIIGCFSLLIFETVVFTSFSPEIKYKIYRSQFVIVLNLVLGVGSKYFWRRLIKDILSNNTPKYIALLWKACVIIFLCLTHLASIANYFLSKDPTILGMASWTCFGAFILLFCILSSLSVIVRMLNRLTNRRLLSRRKQSCFGAFATIVCTYFAFLTALSPPQVVNVEVPIAKLPQSMDGLRIALISDIHLGPTVGYTLLNRLVKMTEALNPDLVVLAGDLTDATVAEMGDAAHPLQRLRPKYGKYFTTGNHEYYTGDVENWFRLLESLGFNILHNSNVKVADKTDPSKSFCMLGTDDIQADQISYGNHGMKLAEAYKGCDPSKAAILVAHQPRAAKTALDSTFDIQLVLSGHTHGGQIYPIIWMTRLVNPYLCGLYQHSPGKYVYVSQGSVYYGFPLRLGSFPEITDITLRSV